LWGEPAAISEPPGGQKQDESGTKLAQNWYDFGAYSAKTRQKLGNLAQLLPYFGNIYTDYEGKTPKMTGNYRFLSDI
jgi:hypothetical protein